MQFDQFKRREFIMLLGGAAAVWPLAARAQPAGKVWRIGMLDTTGEAAKSADISAFRRGLAELGYTEEKNLIIDYRSADGRPERFPLRRVCPNASSPSAAAGFTKVVKNKKRLAAKQDPLDMPSGGP